MGWLLSESFLSFMLSVLIVEQLHVLMLELDQVWFTAVLSLSCSLPVPLFS